MRHFKKVLRDPLTPVIMGVIFIISASVYGFRSTKLTNIPDYKAALCILGEAEGQSYEEKLAIAHALINRNTTLGVYGCRSRRVLKKLYPKQSLVDSQMAWVEAKKNHWKYDPTKGAEHWLSLDDFYNSPSWVGNCDRVAKVGAFYFLSCL